MITFFIHLALDRFGAECAGKLTALLNGLADPEYERHVFAWAGQTSAPTKADYWTNQYPIWDHTLPSLENEPSVDTPDLGLDRAALGRAVAEAVSDGPWREKLEYLTRELPREKLSAAAQAAPLITVSCSLADPAGSAILLGLLSGFGRLRSLGLFDYPRYILAGIGADSSSVTSHDEKTRALAAVSLQDIQSLFSSSSNLPHIAVPILLIGENKIGEMASSRRDQVAVGGLTMMGLTRSLIRQHGEKQLSDHCLNPFRFVWDADGRCLQADREFTAQTPFSAVGAYGVRVPVRPLTRVLGARLTADLFRTLAQQQTLKRRDTNADTFLRELGRRADNSPMRAALEEAESLAVGKMWRQLAEMAEITWEKDDVEHTWFSVGRIRQVFEKILDKDYWNRIIRNYGVERLKKIPLGDWDSALDELTQVVDDGYVPWHERQIQRLKRRIYITTLRGIDLGMEHLFDRSLDDPIKAAPHSAAQLFLGRIFNSIQRQKDVLEREHLVVHYIEEEHQLKRRRLQDLRKEISQAIAAVPSPAAIIMRLAPAMALGVGLGMLVSLLFEGAPTTPLMRIIIGVALGLLISGGLFYTRVSAIRRRLLKLVENWLEYYKSVLSDEDTRRRHKAYQDTVDGMGDLVEWYLCGESPNPPIPDAFEMRTNTRSRYLFYRTDSERLGPQVIVSGSLDYIERAGDRFEKLYERFLREFQESQVETILPRISQESETVFRSEYARLLDIDPGQIDDPKIVAQRVASRMLEFKDWMQRQYAGKQIMPFAAFGEDAVKEEIWRRSFLLADDKDLLNEEIRESSSALQFLTALWEWLASTYGTRGQLVSRIKEYCQRRNESSVGGTPLALNYQNLSMPSVTVSGAEMRSYIVAASPGEGEVGNIGVRAKRDDLVAETRFIEDECTALDITGSLSIRINCLICLDADGVIWRPSREDPTNPLGLAYNAFLAGRWGERSLQPIPASLLSSQEE